MENINLIRKIAWNFHKTTNIDYDELFSEASLAYVETRQRFDPEKGNLGYWAWVCMANHLKLFIQREKEYQQNKTLIQPFAQVTFQPLPFERFRETFSPDIQELIDVVVENQEKIPETLSPKHARGVVVKILRKRGWSWPRIWESFQNIKTALNQT